MKFFLTLLLQQKWQVLFGETKILPNFVKLVEFYRNKKVIWKESRHTSDPIFTDVKKAKQAEHLSEKRRANEDLNKVWAFSFFSIYCYLMCIKVISNPFRTNFNFTMATWIAQSSSNSLISTTSTIPKMAKCKSKFLPAAFAWCLLLSCTTLFFYFP